MREIALRVFGVFVLLSASSLYAQATRTWVSGVGDDANPCSRTAPCKTFAGAITKTATDGIINVIDPGAFGAVTITKAITIDGGDVFAGILISPAGTTGILINAPSTANIVLRNLDLNGASLGANGIRIIGAGNVSIEDCRISGYTQHGIIDERTTAGTLNVVGCEIRNASRTTTTGIGIRVFPATSAANSLTVDRTFIAAQTSAGIEVTRTGEALISNSEVHASNRGIIVSQSNVMIENCMLMNNTTGLRVTSGSARLSASTIFGGGDATNNTSGTPIISFGNNRIDGNTGDNGAGMNNIGVK